MKKINSPIKISVVAVIAAALAMFVWFIIQFLGRKLGIKLFNNVVLAGLGIHIFILISEYFVVKKANEDKFTLEFIGMKSKQNSFNLLFRGIFIGTFLYISWALIMELIRFVDFKGIEDIFYSANKVIINIITLLVLSIFVGFSEEILCRGIILTQLMKYKGRVFAIIISSIIFTMFHVQYYGNYISIIYVFIFQIVSGYLYIITDSIYVSIGLHSASDFYLYISDILFNMKISELQLAKYMGITQIITIIILFLFLLFFNFKKVSKKQHVF